VLVFIFAEKSMNSKRSVSSKLGVVAVVFARGGGGGVNWHMTIATV